MRSSSSHLRSDLLRVRRVGHEPSDPYGVDDEDDVVFGLNGPPPESP